MYKCAICGAEFPNLKALAAHLRRHVDENYGVCPVCGYRYIKWRSFLMHLDGRRDLAHIQLAWAVTSTSSRYRSMRLREWLEVYSV